MRMLDGFFDRTTRDVHVPPFSEVIPLNFDALNQKSSFSLLWRKVRPWFSLWFHGQHGLQRDRIDRQCKRLLWIYKGSPQVGDALMDLSSRVLLRDAGITVDLYTDGHLHALFCADDVFSRVVARIDAIDPADYDLVILDSFKWRCMQDKFAHLKSVPFVTMRGYFSGPEFNRTLFSFFRMNQLLQAKLNAEQIHAMAVPHLCGTAADRQLVEDIGIPDNAVAFAIGGASAGRTYRHWDRVIDTLLHDRALTHIVLLGSRNAVSMRDRIVDVAKRHGIDIMDCVDRYTLPQAFEITRRCRLVVCADGGLLHVANAANIPTVALFDRAVSPDMRLTMANRSFAVQSEGEISDVPVAQVVRAVEEALAMPRLNIFNGTKTGED